MCLRPRARIHLGNIASNWRWINDRCGPGGAGAVVKANAYGHGLAEVSAALATAGCQDFFVAYGFEGAEVRKAVGRGAKIFVFNGLHASSHSELMTDALIPVLNTVSEISDWVKAGHRRSFAIHFDTGMNRLGVQLSELDAVVESLGDVSPEVVMTHFACADEPERDVSTAQAQAFETVASAFPNATLSVSNSAGLWLDQTLRPGLSRPGIALYGGGNSPRRPNQLLPGMTLEAPILQVQDVRAGASIGYGATYVARQPMTVATIGIGYGDGFLRSASNRGFAYLGETRCPIVGRVSMDLVTIDVSAVAPLAKPGAWVELLGKRADLEEQAKAAGSLGYELVTGLGARVDRLYED